MALDPNDDAWANDRPAIREAMAALRRRRMEEEAKSPEPTGPPPGLFDHIVGHEGQKKVLMRALEGDPERPVHVLMVGPPGTAKTEFLLAMERLPHTRRATGASVSTAGLFQFLQQEPDTRRLLLDELDKAKEGDLWLLLELMQSGTISRLKFDRQEQLKRWVQVMAAANSTENLPEPLVSRFAVLTFPAYTREQFIRVTSVILQRREGLTADRAQEIAEAVAERSHDPRAALKVARLAGQSGAIEPIIDQLLPPAPVEPPHTLSEAVARKVKGR